MTRPPTNTPAMALANGAMGNCQTVRHFMLAIALPVIEREENDPRRLVSDLYRRAAYWLSTVEKLDHPSDFQAAIAGARALFEISVDLSLMVGDRALYPVDKLLAWETSAMWKQAAAMVAHHAAVPDFPVPEPMLGYVECERANVQALRDKWWGGKHPKGRWTGRNLPEDTKAADGFRTDRSLEAYYVRRHSPLCWSTHGSGLVGSRQVPTADFPWLLGEALNEAAAFGMLSAELTLAYVGALGAEMIAAMDEIHESRKTAAAIAYAHQRYVKGKP